MSKLVFNVFVFEDQGSDGPSCDLCKGASRSPCSMHIGSFDPPEEYPLHVRLPCLKSVVTLAETCAQAPDAAAVPDIDLSGALRAAISAYPKPDTEDEDDP